MTRRADHVLAVVVGALALVAGCQYRTLRRQGLPRQRALVVAGLTPVIPAPVVTVLRSPLGVLSPVC